MNFLLFSLYYCICTSILLLIFLSFKKIILKNAMKKVSQDTEKMLDDYFNSYDNMVNIIDEIDYNEKRL